MAVKVDGLDTATSWGSPAVCWKLGGQTEMSCSVLSHTSSLSSCYWPLLEAGHWSRLTSLLPGLVQAGPFL